MNLEQALEIAKEYCWFNYPASRKVGLNIKNFKLTDRVKKVVTGSFNRLLVVWGEDNITPRDIHLLIESWWIAYANAYSYAFEDLILIRV